MLSKRRNLTRKLTGQSQFDSFARLGIGALATNSLYLVWLSFHIVGVLGIVFISIEVLIYLVLIVFTFNHWTRKYQLLGGSYSMRASVDVFIPTVNEPIAMLTATIAAAVDINYARKTVYILDDGDREAVKKLAAQYGCTYLTREKTPTSKYKSANLNNGMRHSNGDFILALDADNVVSPTILDDLLGHFKEDKIAIVASRQVFTVEKRDFNHDHLFYNYMQSGKNKDGAAISCGSGVIYRRAMLDDIGGFSEWNIVEDLHTTYIANGRGYHSIYVTQPYVRGHAPRDVRMIYKQRGTWAVDTLRLFFWQQPLVNFKLTFRQRLHYFEMGYCYLVSGILLPAVYIINFYTLFSGNAIQSGGWWYLVARVPALICTLAFFGRFSQGQLTNQVWFGLFPVYAKAALLALVYRRKKPVYRVTSKIDTGKREISLVAPQLVFIITGYVGVIYHLEHFGLNQMFWLSSFWTIIMTFWLYPIIKMGFSAKGRRPKQAAQPLTITPTNIS